MRKNSVSLLGGERFFCAKSLLKILYGHGRRGPEVWNESGGLGDDNENLSCQIRAPDVTRCNHSCTF